MSQYPLSQRSRARAVRRPRGQIMPLALFGVALASAVLVLMYRSGNGVTEKSELVNAADAAAYSGAVWTARHLNFMAYTNRAMVANHVTVGHFVSYVSWLRYVAGTVQDFKRFAQFIPYVGTAVSAINAVLQQVKQITEQTARVTIPAIDGVNLIYRTAQLEAKGTLALGGVYDLMERTARTYDPDLRVNDLDDVADLPVAVSAPILNELGQQQARLLNFVQQFRAGSDGGRINDVIGKSLAADDDLRRWVNGDRGWRERLLCDTFIKQGSTAHSQNSNGADWRATDRLRRREECTFSRRTRNLGRQGSASAREFARTYQGVPSYYELSNSDTGNRPSERGMKLFAVLTKPQNRNGNTGADGYADTPLMGLQNTAETTSFVAAAVAEFKRPTGFGFSALGGNNVEYANLFNPFWSARLTKPELFNGVFGI